MVPVYQVRTIFWSATLAIFDYRCSGEERGRCRYQIDIIPRQQLTAKLNALYYQNYQICIHLLNGGRIDMQLTVRDVDSRLHETLRQEAQQRGISVNRLILQLLSEAVGLRHSNGAADVEYHDLDHLFGTWSAEEASEFEQELAVQRQIDDALWQ